MKAPFCSLLVLILVFGAAGSGSVFARGRGISQGQVKAMQAYQKQVQQEFERMAKQEQAEQQAFMNKFDTNRDGQINGKEKGPAEKYLRERRMGKADPLAPPVSLDPIGGKERGKEGKKQK